MGRNRLVAGNWKMNGSSALIRSFFDDMKNQSLPDQVGLLLCPPLVYLPEMLAAARGTGISVGAQTVCETAEAGAFTGEVSAEMLSDIGASHVIVGHSERRHIYGESSDMVASKFAAAQSAGLVPILCVGETLEEREAGNMETVLAEQLGCVLSQCGASALGQAIVAYEPVWAIGTGKTASPEQAQAAHAFLRSQVAAQDDTIAAGLQILYGGSVKPDNAAELFACEDVDGGLIGGASLKVESFLGIARAG
jgi:triosephosphate isomerase